MPASDARRGTASHGEGVRSTQPVDGGRRHRGTDGRARRPPGTWRTRRRRPVRRRLSPAEPLSRRRLRRGRGRRRAHGCEPRAVWTCRDADCRPWRRPVPATPHARVLHWPRGVRPSRRLLGGKPWTLLPGHDGDRVPPRRVRRHRRVAVRDDDGPDVLAVTARRRLTGPSRPWRWVRPVRRRRRRPTAPYGTSAGDVRRHLYRYPTQRVRPLRDCSTVGTPSPVRRSPPLGSHVPASPRPRSTRAPPACGRPRAVRAASPVRPGHPRWSPHRQSGLEGVSFRSVPSRSMWRDSPS